MLLSCVFTLSQMLSAVFKKDILRNPQVCLRSFSRLSRQHPGESLRVRMEVIKRD